MEIHNLKLQQKPFNSIKNKEKTIEMRLYDDKRKLIKLGDEIIFTNIVTNEKLKTKVLSIKLFKNFEELYNNFDKTKLGYKKNEIASPEDMNIYYSVEEQKNFGVCAIEIKVI
mgnify:CR=1 FL=1